MKKEKRVQKEVKATAPKAQTEMAGRNTPDGTVDRPKAPEAAGDGPGKISPPPPAEFKELNDFCGWGEGFERGAFEKHTHLMLEGAGERLCMGGCKTLLLCQDLKMATGEVYGGRVYELDYMQACRWIARTGCQRKPDDLLGHFNIYPKKDEYYWHTVPTMNEVMDAARREELRTVLIEAGKRIGQTFDLRLGDGLAGLRVTYCWMRHHPDLRNVAEALDKMARGHLAILRLKEFETVGRQDETSTGLQYIYRVCEKANVRQATDCLEGLQYFIAKDADFGEIGAALNDVVEGFVILLRFVDEVRVAFDRADAAAK
jgi:hypothetical protein